MGRARERLSGLALGEPGGPRGEGSGLAWEVVRAAGGLGLSGKGERGGGLGFFFSSSIYSLFSISNSNKV